MVLLSVKLRKAPARSPCFTARLPSFSSETERSRCHSALAGSLAENPTDDPDDPAVPRDHQTLVTLAAGEVAGMADFGYVWSAEDAVQIHAVAGARPGDQPGILVHVGIRITPASPPQARHLLEFEGFFAEQHDLLVDF